MNTFVEEAEGVASRVEASFRLDEGGSLLTLSTREARALGPLVVLRQRTDGAEETVTRTMLVVQKRF